MYNDNDMLSLTCTKHKSRNARLLANPVTRMFLLFTELSPALLRLAR